MTVTTNILPQVAQEILVINGLTFHVHIAMTHEQVAAAGRKNTARVMLKNGIAREITASRGNGTRLYMINEFKFGTYRGWERSVA